MQPPPRFLVVCGDLIDAMPGVAYRAEQIRDFKVGALHYCRIVYAARLQAVLTHLNPVIMPVCVCGNHDIGNTPTPQTVADYARDFGADYFAWTLGGCRFVVVNSQYYQVRMAFLNTLKILCFF
jgi:hypothetical protein